MLWSIMLICMIGCWYLATPGPVLIGQHQKSFAFATNQVLMAVLFLLFIPGCAAILNTRALSLSDIGCRIGDWKFGCLIIALLVIPVSIGVFVGAADRAMIEAYPWPGKSVGDSYHVLIAWFSVYFLYYAAFEFFFRGFMLRVVEQRSGIVTALWVQTACSVLLHLGKPLVETVAAFPAALFFAWLAIRTRSLIYPILLHFLIGIVNDLGALHHFNQTLQFPGAGP